MDPATSTPLVLWIPQGHAERGESFWTAVPALLVEASGHSVSLVGEPAPGDRVWISIRVGGLGEDGQPQRLATREGGTTAAIVRVLPRGAGIGDLLRKDRKVDPANIVALVIALALLAYYLAT